MIIKMKNTAKKIPIILFLCLVGILSTDNVKSEEIPSDESLWCHTAWIPNPGTFIKRCGYCDILLNKRGSWSGSTCPPTAN